MKKFVILKMIILLINKKKLSKIPIFKKICLKRKINKFQMKKIKIKMKNKLTNNKILNKLLIIFLKEINKIQILYMIKLKKFIKNLKYFQNLKKIKVLIILILYLKKIKNNIYQKQYVIIIYLSNKK